MVTGVSGSSSFQYPGGILNREEDGATDRVLNVSCYYTHEMGYAT